MYPAGQGGDVFWKGRAPRCVTDEAVVGVVYENFCNSRKASQLQNICV